MTISDSPPAAILDAVRMARSGRQAEAVPRLVALSSDPDPQTRWTATAAQLGWWWWTGQSAHAADLAEHIVVSTGGLANDADLVPITEFVVAIAAAAYYDGADPAPRLERMAAALPHDHHQYTLISGNLEQLVAHPRVLLPMAIPAPEAMSPANEALLRRDPGSLGRAAADGLYADAANRGRRDVLLALLDSGQPVPDRGYVLTWLAQTLAEAGRPAEARALLVRYLRTWLPSGWWQTLPSEPPLCPELRFLVTDDVRRAALTDPVAEE